MFSWSYETFDPGAARLLRLLGLHPGPDTGLCAAASLSGLPVGTVVGLLDKLRRANLVAEVAPARYAMHDLLRAYARELADRVDGGDAAPQRLLDYYLHTAQAASNRLHGVWSDLPLAPPAPGVTVESLTDAAAANAWLDREHHALLGAASLAAQGGHVVHVWGLAWTLTLILDTRGYWREYLATQRVAVQVVDRGGDPVGQAYARHGLGRALSCLGRDVEAADELRTAFRRYEAVDDRAGMADVQLGLGFLCDRRGDHDGALAAAQLALALFRAAGHRSGEAASLGNIGWSLTELGDYEQALTCCSAGLAVHEELGDLRGSASSWHASVPSGTGWASRTRRLTRTGQASPWLAERTTAVCRRTRCTGSGTCARARVTRWARATCGGRRRRCSRASVIPRPTGFGASCAAADSAPFQHAAGCCVSICVGGIRS